LQTELLVGQSLRPLRLSEWTAEDSNMQGCTGVSKAARENVRNGPKSAKIIHLNIDNRPSKLRFRTALVLRMSSGVNLV